MRRYLLALAGGLAFILGAISVAAATPPQDSTRGHHGPIFRLEDLNRDEGSPGGGRQDSGWMALAPLPAPVEGHCTARVGNQIFTAYGFSSGDSNQLRIYDIASNTWSLGPAAPLPVRSEGYRGVATGGKLYCIGGRSPFPGGPPLANLQSFDPATSTWSTLASMPDARSGTTAAVQDDGIFVFGGRKAGTPCAGPAITAGATSTILRFDIAMNTWSNAGNLAVARSDATAARVGDLIYIFGGCNGTTFLSSVEVYNPRTQVSTLLPVTLTGGPRADAAAASVDRLIHVTGGWRPSGPPVALNHLVFDPETATFTVATSMPTHCPDAVNRAEFELVFHGDRIYAVGGSCPAFGASQNNLDVLKVK